MSSHSCRDRTCELEDFWKPIKDDFDNCKKRQSPAWTLIRDPRYWKGTQESQLSLLEGNAVSVKMCDITQDTSLPVCPPSATTKLSLMISIYKATSHLRDVVVSPSLEPGQRGRAPDQQRRCRSAMGRRMEVDVTSSGSSVAFPG